MRITRLHLQGIRRHRDLDISPSAGLTVIRGPNEAGKSTVQAALEMALFRKVTSTARELQDVRTWGTTDDPVVELTFEHEGATGRLTKLFAGQKGTVELELDGQLITDLGQVDTIVAEMTGLPSEKFLRSTASVRHQELDDLDRDEGALRDRLQQSISGADGGTHTARRLLGEAVRRYRSEGVRNPGLVKQARTELERLRTELAEGEVALTRLEADRNALALAHDVRSKLDDRLAHDQDALDAGERAVRLETSATDAESRYMRLRKAVDLQGRITHGERDHPSSTPLPELKEGVRRLKDLQFQIQELESGLELQPDLSAAPVPVVIPPRWQPFALLAMVVLLGALVMLGVTVVTSTLPFIAGMVSAIALLVLGIGIGVWAVKRRHRSRDVRRQAGLQEVEIQRRLRGRTQEEEQLRLARRERDALLTSLGVADVYAGDALLERQAAHSAAIEELRAELRGVLEGVHVSGDLAVERDRAAAEMDQSRHALSGLGGVAQDPANARVRALQTLRQTQQEREAAIQAEGQAQGRVDQNSIDAERVASSAESVADVEQRLAGLERRARIYELTLAALDRAEQVTVKIAARYLEEHMGGDLARITDGRYRRVEVNELDLTFRVWSAEAAAWVSVQQLSRGTLDQVYLVARLGLVRQVTHDQRPPLIFDDPFVTFDDERARRAAGMLRELAADHQVLYLTTSDRYDSVADSVVELLGPTIRDELTEDPPPSTAASTPVPEPDSAAEPVAQEEPEEPVAPDEPEEPEGPDVPLVADEPEEPGAPEEPDLPEEAEDPFVPLAAADAPEEPATPEERDAPLVAEEPDAPVVAPEEVVVPLAAAVSRPAVAWPAADVLPARQTGAPDSPAAWSTTLVDEAEAGDLATASDPDTKAAPVTAGTANPVVDGGIRGLNLLGPVLALLSAASWGAGDFFGGLATRRAHVLMALVATQAFGAALAVSMVVVSGEARPSDGALFWAAAAGASGLVGLAGLFLALSRGAMGLVAPLTAVVAAAVPAIVGVVGGDSLDPIVLIGMLLALAAVVAVAMPDRSRPVSDPNRDPGQEDLPEGTAEGPSGRSMTGRPGRFGQWALILMAGLGFAGFFLGVDRANDLGSGAWWTLASARLTSLAIIVVVTGALVVAHRAPSVHGLRGVLPLLVLSAVGDTGGNLFFVLSRGETTLAVSVVLSSLYPVSTAILARVVLGERLSRLATVGVGLAVTGVVLIGLGSTSR